MSIFIAQGIIQKKILYESAYLLNLLIFIN